MAKQVQSTPSGNPDYIQPGSDEHAALLGLVKGDKGEWVLADVTAYGPMATDKFLGEVLRQKVAELNAPPPKFQSDDPRKPNYAPKLWNPPVKTPGETISQSTVTTG